jgi:hypothetical protein
MIFHLSRFDVFYLVKMVKISKTISHFFLKELSTLIL